jgi:hypothetical protein
MSDGGYWIITKSGRRFFVQPVRQRNERERDVAFKNGGISGDGVKGKPADNGALLGEEADEKLKAIGCKRFWTLPEGMSPDGFIEWLEKHGEEPTVFEDAV